MNANKKSSQLSNLLLIYFFVYFALTLINVIFALLGFLCFVVPFIILYVRKKNDWCRFYCPRANMFTRLLSKISVCTKSGATIVTLTPVPANSMRNESKNPFIACLLAL